MDEVHLLAQVRSLIHAKFQGFGGPAEVTPDEALLIRNGYYCGRRFHCDGLQAVWFVEESEIKFYDRDGAILEVIEWMPEVGPMSPALPRAA